jgi:hypothetical protein
VEAAGVAELGEDRDRGQLPDSVDLIDQRPAAGLFARIPAEIAVERDQLRIDRVDDLQRDLDLLARRRGQLQAGEPLTVLDAEHVAPLRAAVVIQNRMHPLLPLGSLV